MPKKILINSITLEGSNLNPLLLKAKYWLERGEEVTFLGNEKLKKYIYSLNIIKEFKFIELENTYPIDGISQLIFEGFRRNILVLFYLGKLKGKFDIIYSISSVLDLTLFPFIMKIFDKKILWVSVFDNIVPFTDPGNKLIRFLAWFFFRISFILLRSADIIVTISPYLKDHLLNKGFSEKKIVIRNNGIENWMIKKAKGLNKYNIDALFIGRINETKGIYDMLKVLQLVKKRFLNFQFAIIGDGDKQTVRRFKNEIKDLKLKANVQFLGYISGIEKYNIIKSSKVFWFLSLSQSESWGVALLEAVCSGKPSFAYDLPAYSYYQNNEIFSFKLHDYQSVARKVIEVFDKKEFNNQNGKMLLGKYRWDKAAKIELDFINRLSIAHFKR